ncbi:MAG: NAD(P)/FAD-dependent oxidoreductase [Anaerolineales bacterium]|nr:NAD(P)/FAD-dependent oxidoreductase [Anaerolineales bacterium]
MTHCTVAIIGAGPSGIAAGVQLTRYGISTLLLEAEAVGGLLRNANWVENYPAFPNGIKGIDLAQRMEEQLRTIGVELLPLRVQKVEWDGKQFHLLTASQTIHCDYLILASGTRPRLLPDRQADKAAQQRIFYQVVDLHQPRQAKIAIIGAGDAAFDYALNLAADNHVEILNRTEVRRCLPLLWERAMRVPTIRYTPNTELLWAEPERNKGLRLTLSCLGEVETRWVDYLLVAIGRDPNLSFLDPTFAQQLAALEVAGRCYRIGDVKNGIFRQTAIAVGDGLKAAMQIYHLVVEVS